MPHPHAHTPAAIFIRRQIELLAHRKTQREISQEVGFANPSMLSGLKLGTTKLPLDRVPAIARAIETDPAILMQLALEQSVGKSAATAILQVFGTPTTVNERIWLEEIRDASGRTDPCLSDAMREKLRSIVQHTRQNI